MKLILHKILNTSVLVSPKKAMQLYRIISYKLKNGRSINIDFGGIQGATLSFLYIVFTNVAKDCEKNSKELKKLISISNVSANIMEAMKYFRDNYRQLSIKFDGLEYSYV